MCVFLVREMAPQQRVVQVSLRNVTPNIPKGGRAHPVGRGPKEDEVRELVGATVGSEAQGDRAGVVDGAAQHL